MFRNALITGTSGFVGSYFLSFIIDKFPRISINVGGRSTGTTERFGARIQNIPLDLSKDIENQLVPDVVFHIAGEKRDESRMWDVNREGTRRLLDWSARQGVKRFIYLSSVGVYGAQKNSGNVTESTLRHPNNTYEASKNAAEDLVKEYCPKCGIDYVILQPSNVIGWVDGKAFPLLGMIRMIKSGLFTYFDNGRACFNYVAVEDVVAGLASAMLPQAANRTFILNSPAQMKLAVDWISDELGVAPSNRRLPATLGYLVGEVASTLSLLTGKSLPFSRERFNELTNTTRYDGGKITERIGFAYPLGVEGAIRKLVRHYVKEGLL